MLIKTFSLMKNKILSTLPLLLIIGLIFSTESCRDDEPKYGQFQLVFKMLYDGQPMPIQSDHIYTYPDSEMQFYLTKYSFYMSDLQVDDQEVDLLNNDAKLISFTTDFATVESSEAGFKTDPITLQTGEYEGLNFLLGVKNNLNNLLPTDFSNASDLSLTGEFWAGWESYIFTKTEGKLKAPDSTSYNFPFALHTGGVDLAKKYVNSVLFTVSEGEITEIPVYIDLYHEFKNKESGKVYDILDQPRIHRKDQEEFVTEIYDNLLTSFD